MEELIIKEQTIENMIYEIRGKYVMLDKDLAILYGTTTGNLNRARSRNIDRFPNEFYFQLSKVEFISLKCQNGISKLDERTINRNLPYAYTEEGVAMLSSVIHTKIAAEISVKIMLAFVAMRHYIIENQNLYMNAVNVNNKLDNHEVKLLEHDNKFLIYDKKINQLFNKFDKKEKTESVYFNGELFDAYSKIVDIISSAKKELIIIDGYADRNVLDMIREIKANAILICKKAGKLTELDVKKYNEQYNNLKVIYNDTWHDRYLILDKKIIYHLGASLNYAGKRTFGINKLEEKEIIRAIFEKLNTIVN